MLRRDPRVVVLRTFSKIYGLAALRVGYASRTRR
jgi:histidinol-phosphate aminotransferase